MLKTFTKLYLENLMNYSIDRTSRQTIKSELEEINNAINQLVQLCLWNTPPNSRRMYIF